MTHHSPRTLTAAAALVAVVALLLAPAPTADAAKPTAPSPLEIKPAPAPTEVIGLRRIEVGSGVPRGLYHLSYKVPAGTPEDMAASFLRDAVSALGLDDPALGDLAHRITVPRKAGSVVRFRQHVDGVPVYGAEVAITLDGEDRVTFVASTYEPGVVVTTGEARLGAADARARALGYLKAAGGLHHEASELVVWPGADGGRLAWRVELTPRLTPRGDWELLVDAETGAILRAEDKALYGVPTTVDATGQVFEPDPLSSAGATYGDTGFTDNGDADSAQLTAEVVSRTLRDVTEDSGTYSLTGPWAECVDWDLPFKGCFDQAAATWNYTRAADDFEAANTYFHIDTYMRYLNDTLGLAIEPLQYPGGVQFDPSGFSGADNSSYSSGTGRLRFGEGGVDDAEDADVVIHELGHGLHDWATGGSLSQVEGLSEGMGDYAAGEYSRSFGQWTPADPAYHYIFSWDGHNPFWGGRVSNWTDTHTYPGDLVGQIHTDGQFWSSCNLQVWDALGRDATNTAHWEGIKSTGGGTNQQEAAQAVVQAAVDLGYPGPDVATMVSIYQGCGYAVAQPPIFADGFESGDTSQWSAAVP